MLILEHLARFYSSPKKKEEVEKKKIDPL